MDFIPQMEPNFSSEEADAVYDYMKSGGWVTEFKKSREFEQMICDYTGAKFCHLVNNGTLSLSLALLAVGVQPGDKVLVPNLTMIATPNAVKFIGCVPVFGDVSGDSLTLDMKEVKRICRKEKIKAVIHVSLNTRVGDLTHIKDFCTKNNISFIEDSAQSLGSFYKGKHVGTFGDIGSFSFSSPKIISTGQGGCLVTNDEELSEKIRRLKDFGRDGGGNDSHPYFGINCKFTDLQSVIGIEQMKKLPERVDKMKDTWKRYYDRLNQYSVQSSHGIKIEMFPPNNQEGTSWIPWFVDIYLSSEKVRDNLMVYLKSKKIETRKVYPPINRQKIYESPDQDFPVSNDWAPRGLWLPSSSKLSHEDIDQVCQEIENFFNC